MTGRSDPVPSPAAQPAMLVVSELALAACTLAAVVGLGRVFDGWKFLPALVVTGLGSHLLAVLGRRLGLPLVVSLVVSGLGGSITIALMFYRDTTWLGLPTSATWHGARIDLAAAAKLFPSQIPPVTAEGGFLLAAVAATWVLAFLADSLGFRAKSSLEAVLPSGVLFVFASAISTHRLQMQSSLLWLICGLVFVLSHRSFKQLQSPGWLTGHRRGACLAFAKGGVVLGSVALALGALIGPRLPGSHEKAIVRTSHPGDSTVFAISPLVEIKKRLSSRSTAELFSVRSDVKTYWRITSLPDFDGAQWSSDLKQGNARGTLGRPATQVAERTINASFTVGALGSIWMPSPFLAIKLNNARLDGATKFDRDTATMLVPAELRKGDTYEIIAQTPVVDPAALRQASQNAPTTVDRRYFALPADYPDNLRSIAKELTAKANTGFDKALALQNWFQTQFVYDLGVDPGQRTGDIEEFLTSRRGYCEQFSGTFAAFARSVGLASRVAVGFTPGILKEDGLYHVQALHAHAWPEVYFDGIGWLAFEPTPGRGNPTAESYTGIAAQQADEAPIPTTIPVTTTAAFALTTTTSFVNRIPDEPVATPVPIARSSFGRYRTVLMVLGAVALVVLYPIALRRIDHGRWRRRRRRARQNTDKLAISWYRTTDVLSHHDVAPLGGETPLAFADRVSESLALPRDLLPILADAVTRATYAGEEPSDRQLRDAERVPLRTLALLEERLTQRGRLRHLFDPRPLFKQLPGDRPKPRRFG